MVRERCCNTIPQPARRTSRMLRGIPIRRKRNGWKISERKARTESHPKVSGGLDGRRDISFVENYDSQCVPTLRTYGADRDHMMKNASTAPHTRCGQRGTHKRQPVRHYKADRARGDVHDLAAVEHEPCLDLRQRARCSPRRHRVKLWLQGWRDAQARESDERVRA